jgi:pyridoxal phosphate enzyme (YggS family)
MHDVLRSNIEGVRERIANACVRAGRAPGDVRLMAVTKSVGADAIQALPQLGVTDIGENRVQDARGKQLALGGTLGLRWHMIGHLQTNKVRQALGLFDSVQSLDSLHLAQEIERRLACGIAAPGCAERPYPVLIECNVSGEASKFGVRPADLVALIEAVRPLAHLRVEGLLTMAPFAEDPEAARPTFAALRELAAQARARTGLPLPHFSMGMTQDFEVAIEEGATIVRIGTALFRGV